MLLQANVDAALIRQDQLRAARPQASLKLRPPNSLNYRVHYEPQSAAGIFKGSTVVPDGTLQKRRILIQMVLNDSFGLY